jgi:ABC-type oligopeptide transport system ATPase subunit
MRSTEKQARKASPRRKFFRHGRDAPHCARGTFMVIGERACPSVRDRGSGITPPDGLLAVDRLVRRYPLPRQRLFGPAPELVALDGVSFAVARGRSFGVVGESGSGKSTLARLCAALDEPTSGTVRLLGRDLFALRPRELRAMRRHVQMVFQDPFGSLDPRLPIGRIVAEPMEALSPRPGRGERRERVAAALAAVGLRPSDAAKYPHEFSGGQRQRIAIARALITRPALIVADEPVSALDVSVQAQVLNLMRDLQERHGVTYLFISHDLRVVEHVCADLAVMRRGRIVERGPAAAIFARPAHPYTRALLDAVPSLDPGARRRRHVRAPEPEPSGGGTVEAGELSEVAPGHWAACHFAGGGG